MMRRHHDARAGFASRFGERGISHFARCRLNAAATPSDFDPARDQLHAHSCALAFAMREPCVGVAAQPVMNVNRYDASYAGAACGRQARQQIKQSHRVAAAA